MTDAKTRPDDSDRIGKRLTAAEAMELAYGMIWHVAPLNDTSERGRCVSVARVALLGQLDRAGRRRGIAAAKAMILRMRRSPQKSPHDAPRLAHLFE